jgi:hypothetical protein
LFTISSALNIRVVSDGSAHAEYAGVRLAQLLKEQHGLELEVVQEKGAAVFELLLGNPSEKPSLEPVSGKDEGYVLSVGEKGAVVRANTARGLFHGTMTVRQLVSGRSIRGCEMIDYPRYELRGFMVDAGRAPARLAHVKRIIRISSKFKPWSCGNRALEDGMNRHLKHQGIEALLEPECEEVVLMGAKSSSSHGPLNKCGYEKAFRNLAEWAMIGNERDNFLGLIACQWHGNPLDMWLPDFLVAADVAWGPPADVTEYEPQMNAVLNKLSELKDSADPAEHETTPSAWHGMWVEGRNRDALIAPLPEPNLRKGKPGRKKSGRG